MQLSAISSLDTSKLSSVLHATDHDNLVLTNKECVQLKELVDILTPFVDATALTKGDQMVTLSCTEPCVLLLKKTLDEMIWKTTTISHLMKTLLQSLHDWFTGLFSLLRTTVPSTGVSHNLRFNDNLFHLSAALDPVFFGFSGFKTTLAVQRKRKLSIIRSTVIWSVIWSFFMYMQLTHCLALNFCQLPDVSQLYLGTFT